MHRQYSDVNVFVLKLSKTHSKACMIYIKAVKYSFNRYLIGQYCSAIFSVTSSRWNILTVCKCATFDASQEVFAFWNFICINSRWKNICVVGRISNTDETTHKPSQPSNSSNATNCTTQLVVLLTWDGLFAISFVFNPCYYHTVFSSMICFTSSIWKIIMY